MIERLNKRRLGDVCNIVGGGTPSKKIKAYYGGDIPWATVRDMNVDHLSTTEHNITRLGLKNSSTNVVPRNNVIIATRVGLGKACLLKRDTAINQDLKGIIPKKPNLLPTFLLYWFKSISDRIVEAGTGATVQGVKLTFINSLQIPLPPLSEQKQIVAILNEAFEAIGKAKANIEKNIQNAEELFQSKLNQIFTQTGEGWNFKNLGEVCEISMGQSPKGSTYNKAGEGTPLINGPVEFGPLPFSKTVMSKWTTEPTKMCEAGDLILCVRGSTTGRINLSGFRACIGRGVASIRYRKNQEWLNYFIRANQQNIYAMGSGSTFPNVSGKVLSQIPFPEAPIDVQNKFIEQMNLLLKQTIQGSFLYKKKVQALKDLKKSILQKAFSGELTKNKEMAA